MVPTLKQFLVYLVSIEKFCAVLITEKIIRIQLICQMQNIYSNRYGIQWKKSMFFKRWSQSNILDVKDLLDENGNLRFLQQHPCILNDETNLFGDNKVIQVY